MEKKDLIKKIIKEQVEIHSDVTDVDFVRPVKSVEIYVYTFELKSNGMINDKLQAIKRSIIEAIGIYSGRHIYTDWEIIDNKFQFKVIFYAK